MKRQQIGIKLNVGTLAQIERLRGALNRTAFIEAAVLTEIARRANGRIASARTGELAGRSPAPERAEPKATLAAETPKGIAPGARATNPPVISGAPLYRGPKRNARAAPKGA